MAQNFMSEAGSTELNVSAGSMFDEVRCIPTAAATLPLDTAFICPAVTVDFSA